MERGRGDISVIKVTFQLQKFENKERSKHFYEDEGKKMYASIFAKKPKSALLETH